MSVSSVAPKQKERASKKPIGLNLLTTAEKKRILAEIEFVEQNLHGQEKARALRNLKSELDAHRKTYKKDCKTARGR